MFSPPLSTMHLNLWRICLANQQMRGRVKFFGWKKDEKRRNDSELVLFNDYFERGRERSNKQSDGERTCSVSLEETKERDDEQAW